LPDYKINLEYQGPFHGVTEGRARDVLRNIGMTSRGYRVVALFQQDLKRLKPRLLELIGKPVMVGVGT
jgi:very-short-patch-repair endonuclease